MKKNKFKINLHVNMKYKKKIRGRKYQKAKTKGRI